MRPKPEIPTELLEKHEKLRGFLRIADSDKRHAQAARNTTQSHLEMHEMRLKTAKELIPKFQGDLKRQTIEADEKSENYKVIHSQFYESKNKIDNKIKEIEQWEREEIIEQKKLNELRGVGTGVHGPTIY